MKKKKKETRRQRERREEREFEESLKGLTTEEKIAANIIQSQTSRPSTRPIDVH